MKKKDANIKAKSASSKKTVTSPEPKKPAGKKTVTAPEPKKPAGKKAAGKKKSGNNLVEVVFILDRSGSMGGLEADTIGGFNSTLEKQKKEKGEVLWSTVLFDNEHEVIHNRVPIERVEELTENEYYVRGCTALLDAIGRAVNHIGNVHKYAREEDVPEKTLFVITTDGMENASREYTYRSVKQMISRQQEKYGWEFLFLGANMDAVSEAGRLGIRAERAASFLNDKAGIAGNYETITEAMTQYRSTGVIKETIMSKVKEDYAKRK